MRAVAVALRCGLSLAAATFLPQLLVAQDPRNAKPKP